MALLGSFAHHLTLGFSFLRTTFIQTAPQTETLEADHWRKRITLMHDVAKEIHYVEQEFTVYVNW